MKMALSQEGEEWHPGVYNELFPPGTVPLERRKLRLFRKVTG